MLRKLKVNISKIEAARRKKGLKKSEVARRAGKHPSTYTLILRGEVASPPTIKAVAEVLGLSMDEVYTDAEEKSA